MVKIDVGLILSNSGYLVIKGIQSGNDRTEQNA